MRRAAILAVLVVVPACTPPAPPAAAVLEPPEVKAFREEVGALLRQAKSLVFVSSDPIPDGGSWMINLKTDAGADLHLQAMHQDPKMGGFAKYQGFLILSKSLEFEIARDSTLEIRLIQLLEAGELVDSPQPSEAKTGLRKLTSRLKDRAPY